MIFGGDWYSGFIEHLVNAEAHTWFSKIIIFGELAVAACLILGAFVGIAAFFGGMMNWSFIIAGSAVDQRYAVRNRHLARVGVA